MVGSRALVSATSAEAKGKSWGKVFADELTTDNRKAPFSGAFRVAGAGFGHISPTGSRTASSRFGGSDARAAGSSRVGPVILAASYIARVVRRSVGLRGAC